MDWQIFNNGFVIFFLIVWDLFWKATGLWKSAKRGDTLWFLAMILINSIGILPIFYLWRTKQLAGVPQEVKSFFKKLNILRKR